MRHDTSRALAFCLGALLAGCAAAPEAPGQQAAAGAAAAPPAGAATGQQAPEPPQAGVFQPYPLPGAGGAIVSALQRSERAAPLRYRVIVVPGSGCAGMGAYAERYFAGLLHAQVLVLHKPGVAPQARTAAGDCAQHFVRSDRPSAWLAHARAALRADARLRRGQRAVPQLLLGISAGAELLPALAPEVPQLAGLVLLSASGLDPQEAGALQARRIGREADWQALARLQAGALPDSALAQGRSLGYWRDLWRWPLAQPLIDGPWPLLQLWGADDALLPASAYRRFALRASGRAPGFCTQRIEGADHGLQQRASGADGVQRLWAWTEQWARAPQAGLCAPLQR